MSTGGKFTMYLVGVSSELFLNNSTKPFSYTDYNNK